MTAKKISSDRKRSRPVEKRSKFTKIKKNKMLMSIILVVIAIVVVGAAYAYIVSNTSDADENNTNDVSSNPIAVFNTTKGTFKVELYPDVAPKTVENFVKLVNEGFYDGMIFHRILDDFMIQAGNTYPDGSTKTSPYGNIEFEGNGKHVDGAISMASTGAGVGGSSQFFICDGEQSGLDGSYAAFGKTVYGIEVVRDIADEDQDNSSPAGGGRPYTDIIIYSITIED